MTHTSRRHRARAAAWLAALASIVACAAPPEDPGPPGAWWVGRAPEVRALLSALAGLEGTPLGGAARQLGAVLPDCDLVGARVDEADFTLLVLETHCLEGTDPLAVERERLGAGVAFAWPVPGAERVRGVLDLDARTLRGSFTWPRPEADGALAWWIPGAASAGPDRLAAEGRLAHVRARPRGGVAPAAWLPASNARERGRAWLFGLVDGLVLDGTWEGAAYAPERPGELPGLALALGVRSPGAAAAAADHLLEDLRRRFATERADFQLQAGAGSCLAPLPTLPELAPCYVATEDALILAWNPRSVRRALGTRADAESDSLRVAIAGPEAALRVSIDLEKLGGLPATTEVTPVSATAKRFGPWRHLRGEARVIDDVLEAHLTLELREDDAS